MATKYKNKPIKPGKYLATIKRVHGYKNGQRVIFLLKAARS